MGIANGANEEDERLPYLPGLGQGDKLAEDEELVADLSSEFRSSFYTIRRLLIYVCCAP
jgi:hypothetical protein